VIIRYARCDYARGNDVRLSSDMPLLDGSFSMEPILIPDPSNAFADRAS
jgi:hypothetical protein